jgi:integrase
MAAGQAGTRLGSDGLNLADYLHEWLAHTRGRVRPRTYFGYDVLIRTRAIPALGSIPLTDLTALQVQGLYSGLLAEGKLSAGTVLNLHLVITQALGQAVRWGLLPVNPASGAQPPRPRRPEPQVVDEALLPRLLDAVRGTNVELPAVIAVSTGMRRGEILALRWSDLSKDLTVAHVRRAVQVAGRDLLFLEPKTRRSRRAVALPQFLRPYLEHQREDQASRRARLGQRWVDLDLLVDKGDGSLLHPDTCSSGWRRILRNHGLPRIRFHDLRHAHATFMLLKGVHPKVVSERLGHASVGITLDIYSHVLPSMQEQAAAAFDELFANAGDDATTAGT